MQNSVHVDEEKGLFDLPVTRTLSIYVFPAWGTFYFVILWSLQHLCNLRLQNIYLILDTCTSTVVDIGGRFCPSQPLILVSVTKILEDIYKTST